eukprot:960494-Amphidinium_carterae.2
MVRPSFDCPTLRRWRQAEWVVPAAVASPLVGGQACIAALASTMSNLRKGRCSGSVSVVVKANT